MDARPGSGVWADHLDRWLRAVDAVEPPPVPRMVARMNAFDQLPEGVKDALRQCVLKLDPQMALRHYNSLLRYGAAAAERDTIAQIWRHGGRPQ